MKGFYWGRGVVRCKFCGVRGHNITTCKLVNPVVSAALNKLSNDSLYILNSEERCALHEIKKREERKVKTRKPRKPPHCSYCGSPKHKRPKCNLLKDFRQMVYQANKNWKRAFTRRINECGLGIGCLIKLDKQTVRTLDFNVDDHCITMITEYNLNNLNVFCALDRHSIYQGNSTIKILSGDKIDNVSVKYLGWLLMEDLVHTGWWYQSTPPTVINPMAWNPDAEWLNSEWDEILNWFFKDISRSGLKNEGIYQFIEEWANKV